MKKVIYVRKTSEGIHITSPSGTVYESWYFDSIKEPKRYMESFFDTLKCYQDGGNELKFETDIEENMSKRFEWEIGG